MHFAQLDFPRDAPTHTFGKHSLIYVRGLTEDCKTIQADYIDLLRTFTHNKYCI